MSDSTTVPVRPGITDPAEGAGKPSFPFRAAEEHRNGRSIGSIWFRMVLLLAALLATKLAMIFGQGESLYELHWRLGGLRPSWVNAFAFFSFIALGGLSLVTLEKSCRSEGVRAVRTLNAVVLALGLVFLFLTFHNGEKNFLYPVLSGVLKWTSLCSYSANSLFFNQPFLAGWVFVYAFAYYVLARTGREKRVLSLTATFAVAYGSVNLRDFASYRDQLLIIDCAGTVSLVAAWVFPRRLRVGWLLLPLAWISFFVWALLRFDNEWHSNAAVYFLGLAGGTPALFAAATLLVRRFGNPIAWSWMLPFFFIGFFLLADTNYPSSRNYNHLLCLAFTLPRYFCGDLALVSCLGVIALVLCKKWPRAGLGFLDFSALALMLLSIVDLRLSQIIGVRLGWDVLAFGDSPRMMLKMARPYLPGVVLGLIALVALYALALHLVQLWSKHASRRSTEPARETASVSDNLNPSHSSRKPEFSAPLRSFLKFPGLAFVVMIFVIMGLLGVAIAESDKSSGQTVVRLIRTSPLWKRVANHPLSEPEFIRSATALGLGDFSLPRNTSPAGPSRDLNVLVVFMESSYNKHLSLFGSTEDTQPELSRYKDRMELFPNFFSAFTGSIHARFATFTSLYPSLDFHAFTQERVPVKSLFEVLHDHGYTCSMFYSSFFDYTGFRDFLKNRGLDEMYDADTMPGQRSTQRVAWVCLKKKL